MQVTETSAEGLKREFKILISAKDIDEKMAGRLQELGQQVKVPGFRPGKVPLPVLKQRFGKSVMGEILERAVSDSSSQAMNERGLRPALQPKIEITAFDEGKDLEYTMAVELLPEIKPTDFGALKLERYVIQVEDKAVEDTLRDLASVRKATKPLAKPRPAASGDVIVIDFKGTVGGESYPGMEAENHHLELGSSQFIEGFEEQLTGAEVGQNLTVKVTFPEAYANDRLSGKEAEFAVAIKEILESVPVEINDELAVALGETDLATLKGKVHERIAGEYKDFSRMRLKRQLLDRLAETHDFPVPDGMVNSEFDSIWRQIEDDRKQDKLDPEDAEKKEDDLKADYRVIAERRVRLGLLISEVGRLNNIDVTQEEVNKALLQEAQRHRGQEREVFEFYQRTPEAMANLRAPIFEDKVVDFIVDLAKVTEQTITLEELRKITETEAAEEAGTKSESKTGAKKGATKKSAAKKPAAKKSAAKKPAAKKGAGKKTS
ncbi:MAG: trigger factor [Alphaproteobacteria bacterium]